MSLSNPHNPLRQELLLSSIYDEGTGVRCVKYLAQGHTVRKWQTQESNTKLLSDATLTPGG